MLRTATVTLPYRTALPRAKSAPSVNEFLPGLVTMSTPKKPIRSALQRARVARSLSQTIEINAENSGAEKLIDTAPARGMSVNASANNVCEMVCEMPRPR